MNKLTVAIYFNEAYFLNDVLTFSSNYYKLAYIDLIKRIAAAGAQVIIARDAETNYVRDFRFKDYWRADIVNDNVQFTKMTGDVAEFHILYDKGRFPFDIPRKINPDRIREICDDKYLTYLFAPEFHPQSFILRDARDLEVLALSHAEKTVALKALDGHGGKQVFVGNLHNYTGNLGFPLLAQEFIDTSGGTPDNLAHSTHDVRVRVFNGEPIGGSLREPRLSNELRSNAALGGKVHGLFVREIPPILVSRTRELDKRFDYSGARFFAADWGFDKNLRDWKLFEINKAPGLAHESEDGPAANEFSELLAEALVKSAKQNV